MPKLLDFLKGEGAIIPFVKRGIGEGLSLAEITADIAKGGIIARDSIIAEAYGRLQGIKRSDDEYVKFLQLNSVPNILRLPLSVTDILKNFSYQLRVQGTDTNTGDIREIDITISTNTILTKQQAIDLADIIATSNEKYELDSASASVTSIVQNRGGIRFGS